MSRALQIVMVNDLGEDISDTPRPRSREVHPDDDWSSVNEPRGRLALVPLDDYIFSLHVWRGGLIFGTIYGRIVEYLFPNDKYLTKGTFRLFQARGEDAVRAVYYSGIKAWGVIGNHAYREFSDESESAVQKFDRRISAQMKYVLQCENRILIPSVGITIMHDFLSNQTWLCPLRLPDVVVVPLDFRDDNLISFMHSTDSSPPALKVVKLPFTLSEPKWGTTVDCIFHQELPKSVTGITKAKFWGDDRVVFVTNGTQLFVFEMASGNRLANWLTGCSDIVIVDASNLGRLITVDVKARLRIWKLSSPLQHVKEITLPSKFDLNQVYLSVQREHIFVYTADSEIAFVAIA